jgi:hypothetical protein
MDSMGIKMPSFKDIPTITNKQYPNNSILLNNLGIEESKDKTFRASVANF